MREALLSLLYKEPAHGYELKLAIESMFGELWPAVNIGQVYQTLSRLERQGLVRSATVTQESRPVRSRDHTGAGSGSSKCATGSTSRRNCS